ncbi:zinc finger protein 329-like [Xiphophorus hellerii]|uniref:zinc finger protein 329-like n=1 Tax=Xiphophorus hellerii TaxID=8084 RepID=UPI0013B3CBCF|nr:zinc finger protein 329-like [Xiphophorus hellerii]
MNISDLRGIITERLGSATREVLAAVERTVAGYEQEATGFRREIDRQRRQLELLQPQVRLTRGANEPIPDLQSQEEEGGEEEEQQPSGEAAESHSRPGNVSDEGAEPTTTFTLNQEDVKDRHYGKPPRKRLNASKLYSLRGTITELLRRATRDVLAAVEGAEAAPAAPGCRRENDGQRRQPELQPDGPTQEVEVVVEEEEQQLTGRTHLETGSHRTRTRTRTCSQSDELLGSGVECEPLNDEDDGGDEEPVNASRLKQEDLTDPDYQIPSRSAQVRGHPGGRRPGRPQLSVSADHLALRVRILEDSRTRVLSKAVFQRSAVLDLQCPRGLSEPGFLDLLRSRCPLLAAGRPFDVFIATKNRRLQPLAARSLTPEQICCGHRSGGNPTLYIRLKESEEPSSADAAAMKRDKTDLHSCPVDSSEEADPGLDAEDDTWSPDPEPQTAKRSRKRKEKRATQLTLESKRSCKVCGAWYRQLGSLISHVWNHAGDPQGVCGACGEKFESADELKEHLRNHQKVHSCQHCGKTFVSVLSLNLHEAKHTGESRFKCGVCSKTFTNMASLNYHQWLHVEDKPHKCDVCLKTFGLESHLVSHKKLHTVKEKHVCDVCNRSFRLRRAMTQHRLTHSDDKQYACDVCGKRFKLEGSLKVHAKTHTERDRTFLCHVCCRTFLWKGTLMAHLKTHSSVRPFVCTICTKGFWFKCDLKKHMRIHSDEAPYECSECGRRFKQKANLDSHIKIHLGIKRFVCPECGKECSRREHLKVHMRTHNGDKPYKCSVCDRAFTQSHCLKTHMKSHPTEGNLDLDPTQTQEMDENPALDPSQSHDMEGDPVLDPSET